MAIVQTRDDGVLDKERCEKWLGAVYVLHSAFQVLPADPSIIIWGLFSTWISPYIWTKINTGEIFPLIPPPHSSQAAVLICVMCVFLFV